MDKPNEETEPTNAGSVRVDAGFGHIDETALVLAAKKLRRLRLADVGGRKENPATTVKSALQRGLGGFYDDDAVDYILRFGVRYYLEALSRKSQIGYMGNVNGMGADPDCK